MKFKSESSIKRVHAALVKELKRSVDTIYSIRLQEALDMLDWVTSKELNNLSVIHFAVKNNEIHKRRQKEWTSRPQP